MDVTDSKYEVKRLNESFSHQYKSTRRALRDLSHVYKLGDGAKRDKKGINVRLYRFILIL